MTTITEHYYGITQILHDKHLIVEALLLSTYIQQFEEKSQELLHITESIDALLEKVKEILLKEAEDAGDADDEDEDEEEDDTDPEVGTEIVIDSDSDAESDPEPDLSWCTSDPNTGTGTFSPLTCNHQHGFECRHYCGPHGTNIKCHGDRCNPYTIKKEKVCTYRQTTGCVKEGQDCTRRPCACA
jgi:hypothetical protein